MLIVGILVMYETKAFWGLESNSNANTLNCTMNTIYSIDFLPLIIIVAVVAIGAILFMSTAKGFG